MKSVHSDSLSRGRPHDMNCLVLQLNQHIWCNFFLIACSNIVSIILSYVIKKNMVGKAQFCLSLPSKVVACGLRPHPLSSLHLCTAFPGPDSLRGTSVGTTVFKTRMLTIACHCVASINGQTHWCFHVIHLPLATRATLEFGNLEEDLSSPPSVTPCRLPPPPPLNPHVTRWVISQVK